MKTKEKGGSKIATITIIWLKLFVLLRMQVWRAINSDEYLQDETIFVYCFVTRLFTGFCFVNSLRDAARVAFC